MPPLLEALAAEDGSALRWPERHSCLLPALRARGAGFDFAEAAAAVAAGKRSQHRHTLCLARLATFRCVPELLVMKEQLFPGCKSKICPAVNTLQYLVLKFHRGAPFSPIPASRVQNWRTTAQGSLTPSNCVWNKPWTRPRHALHGAWLLLCRTADAMEKGNGPPRGTGRPINR